MNLPAITPCFWFDNEAEEAVKFYSSLFDKSLVKRITRYGKEGFEFHHKPEGSVMTVEFELNGQNFLALNGGTDFKFNESVSLFVYCGSEERINFLYKKLSEGGSVNMPLNKYDWSPKYAWVKDKFGVSWQLDIEDINSPQKIVPAILFANEKFNLVKEAANHFTSIFPNSKIIMEYPFDKSMNLPEGTLLFAQFKLNNYLFNAMSGGTMKHNFDFNDAISFIVYCDTQEEIDYYWQKLADGGQEIQCGWLKDKFGISWQVIPTILNELLDEPNKRSKVMNEIFTMKKFDIATLIKASE
ncbi:VOC family protein [Ignavibacterium sp.]|uniref:VOC family protein n=1 Tax=Ignavibacterium sp. TaxID=2651167 RepID=UPI002202913E|nr:VOC family protein [Ignavibacterium sp.]BDQ03606.1 MAG: VOC family protein [Ignavibacterium sp.]